MKPVREDLIRVEKEEWYGKLPDPFRMENGTRAATPEAWEARRREMWKDAVELQYGTQPPAPDFLYVSPLYIGYPGEMGTYNTYRVTTGRREHPVTFVMRVFLPAAPPPYRGVVVSGDVCFRSMWDDAFRRPMREAGIVFVCFDRTELADDVRTDGRRHGPLCSAYPEYTFGSVGAWAWGYSRCVDALEKLNISGLDCLAFTGHSRGGKTAMLAGVLDPRAAVVNPNETDAGSCSCYRMKLTAATEDGDVKVSETLDDLFGKFPEWLGEGMGEYRNCPEKLPFDAHFLKALVAPRALLVGEAASDIWGNPVGSWQTTLAAKEVYRMLGAEDRLYWYFRPGYHDHTPDDIAMLIAVMRNVRDGAPLPDGFFRTPFPADRELAFDWRAPEKA